MVASMVASPYSRLVASMVASPYSRRPSAKTPTMVRIAPATLASTKPDAALGAALGSEEPAQSKANNQHPKLDQAMPVRTPQ